MEIDLLKNYPKSKRDLKARSKKTDEDREIARKFDKDFFDGDRRYGYGGYTYNAKFWTNTVADFKNHWNLTENSSILDVGCGKGFMIYDFLQLIPNLIKINGIDISKYAIENSKKEISKFVQVANANNLPFDDNSYDYVISINTIHNLDLLNCKKAIKEISRVSKKGSFLTVDAYNNEEDKKRMYDWNLTAKTILSVDEWKKIFSECDYNGDFFWFIP
jgi:ubiquinone/menaquinone biosynthesis C-methylase UbiE